MRLGGPEDVLATHAFELHHTRVEVACQAEFLPALASLLGSERARTGPAHIAYALSVVADGDPHTVDLPPCTARTVYASELGGDIQYVDATDRLYLRHGQDWARVMCEPARGQVQISLRASAVQHIAMLAFPMVTFPLLEMLKRRGRYGLHAAGVIIGQAGVLFPGTSGAGKSTLTLAMLAAGYDALGDDLVFLDRDGHDRLRALAFSTVIQATEDTLRLIPGLRGLCGQTLASGLPKQPLRPIEHFGSDLKQSCKPVALVFPQVARTQRSILSPLDPDAALLELVPNVMLTENASSQRHLDTLAHLVRTTRCYRLHTGFDLADAAEILRRVAA